jgi:hypothetical protein
MALVKLGGGVTGISGSIAGSTFARNRFGSYIRPRTKPVNPKSSGQQLARSVMAYLAEYWHGTATSIQRGGWNTYAAAVAAKNRLGEGIYLTGFNHFIRSNSPRIQIGYPVVAAPPTVLALPETDPIFAVTATVSDQKIHCVFDATLPWKIEAAGYMFVYMGCPQLSTRNFFNGPWKYCGQIVHDDVSPKLLTAPFSLVLGQKIWCYARISRMDSRLSNPFRDDAIVSA